MSIQQVTDLIEAKLLEDPEWGNSLFWGNVDSFQNDYPEAELPITCVHLDGSDMAESSTQADQTLWLVKLKGVFWLGEKITTKPNFEEYERLNDSLKAIYNNIINDLDCAWVTDYLTTSYESIDERMSITGRFTITIETIRN
jgi:hypothetical protein